MTCSQQAHAVYSPAAAPIRTARAIEYEVFAKITARLRAAVDARAGGLAPLAEALHENRRLWTLLASSVADPGNLLPAELRARIFYLAEFTAHHSEKVLNGEADPAVLIEINTSVMKGLRQQAAAA
ncbi:MAG: flagellar biosynthesis regulatory protein FlaF [Alphaproteobacteria bacterium]|nr:MAG: flagellar biosynthesis regulatory protein FlaF [Alphaproteobacteria bacterium]